MQESGWQYYNHAMIPSTGPHCKPNINVINDGTIFELSPPEKLCLRNGLKSGIVDVKQIGGIVFAINRFTLRI